MGEIIKKIFLVLLLVISFAFLPSVIVEAEEPLENIFSYEDYFNNNYTYLKNQVYYGQYFKVGMIGHQQRVEFGDVRLVCYETEIFTPTYAIGDNSSLIIEDENSYSLVNQTTTSAQVQVGIKDIAEAKIKSPNGSQVGGSTELTQLYTFAIENIYAKSLNKNYKITTDKNLAIIPSDKTTYHLGRVVCCLEVEVNKSFEEKNWFGHWCLIDDTLKTNYIVSYYIGDLVTFVYNDHTFGNILIGTYKLEVIKRY